MTEYRVREYQGRFYIEGRFEYKETPYSFWKTIFGIEQKEISKGFKWYDVNEKGRRCMNYYRLGIYDTPCESFGALDAAMERISLFTSPVRYYYPKPQPPVFPKDRF